MLGSHIPRHELSKWEGKLREEWEALCADEAAVTVLVESEFTSGIFVRLVLSWWPGEFVTCRQS